MFENFLQSLLSAVHYKVSENIFTGIKYALDIKDVCLSVFSLALNSNEAKKGTLVFWLSLLEILGLCSSCCTLGVLKNISHFSCQIS